MSPTDDRPAPLIAARFQLDRRAFQLEIDLQLPGRGVTVLFGPSGSGKTTVLRAIAGLERAPGGRVVVNGEVWQDEASGVFVPVHQRAIGFVFQDANLFPHLTVRENLRYGERRATARPQTTPVDHNDIVELLGLGALLDRSPQRLSGGERQRVAIARALLARPHLLLFDEPLSSLDLDRKAEILPYLDRLHDALDIPILYVSHAPDEVLRLADHLVLLEAGRVIAAGPLAETLARPDLPPGLFREIGVVLEGTVTGVNAAYGMVDLALAGGTFHVTHAPLTIGHRLRIQVQSRDVSLAVEAPHGTSVLNVLPARIIAVHPAPDPAQVHVLLDARGTSLVACITRLSSDRLQLAPGREVWAQVKAVAVLS